MFENIKQDYNRSNYLKKKEQKATLPRILFRSFQDSGFRAVFFFRIGRWCRDRHLGLLAAFFERLMRHWSHCWVSTLAKIGPGFVIAHVCGIIIPPDVVFGKNCIIRQNTTLGGNYDNRSDEGRTNPWIGDNVSIGPGAAILGPIRIGSNSIIGANALVTKSVPENSVVGAFRAEIVAKRANDGGIIRDNQKQLLSRHEISEKISALEKRIQELEKRTTS
jgi:serine O-acetyltransferase